MKITYTGRQVELAPAQVRKIESQFDKVSKLLDGKDEREAHVILSHEGRLVNAEITVNYHHHQLVGAAADADLFKALHAAVLKLEKQAIKVRAKWRDTKRTPRQPAAGAAPENVEPDPSAGKTVYRVTRPQNRKPMTVDEALLEMEKNRDYMVYRDTETGRVAILVRRRDGHFDLVET